MIKTHTLENFGSFYSIFVMFPNSALVDLISALSTTKGTTVNLSEEDTTRKVWE